MTRFFAISAARRRPGEFRLLAIHPAARDLLGVAEIDLGAGRTGSAEGQAGELQLGRGLARALADEIEGKRLHLLVILLVENFEAVIDRADRRDDVVADAAAEQRREVQGFEFDRVGHAALPVNTWHESRPEREQPRGYTGMSLLPTARRRAVFRDAAAVMRALFDLHSLCDLV